VVIRARSVSLISAKPTWRRQRFTFRSVPPVEFGKMLMVTSALAGPLAGTENLAVCIGPGATVFQSGGVLHRDAGAEVPSGGDPVSVAGGSVILMDFRHATNAGFCASTSASSPVSR